MTIDVDWFKFTTMLALAIWFWYKQIWGDPNE